MSTYRCDCGDPQCPSCGLAQGTLTEEAPPSYELGFGRGRLFEERKQGAKYARLLADYRVLREALKRIATQREHAMDAARRNVVTTVACDITGIAEQAIAATQEVEGE